MHDHYFSTAGAGSSVRVIAWGIAVLTAAVLAVACGPQAELTVAPAASPVAVAPTPPHPDLQIWQWSSAQTLTAGEEADLNALPTAAIMQWIGSIDLVAGAPRFAARAGPVRGLPAVPRWSVIRIEVRCLPLLGTPAAEQLAELAAKRLPAGSAGLQLDVDVPLRLLPAYGAFLAALRQRLPSGTGLACTGLVSWLSSPDLAATLAAVDWWVPQCYNTSTPKDPAKAVRLVGSGGDLARVVARCEALRRPYRIGLPTFEQVAWWNPDGTLRNAAVSLALEELLAAGLVPSVQPSSAERLLRFTVPSDLTIGTVQLPAGATLLTGQPTVTGLAASLRTVRGAAGTWFRGVALFRLAGDNDLPALATAQLLAAERGTAVPAALTQRWSGGPGAWVLTIANHGTEDVLALDRPLGLAVSGACAAPPALLPGGIRCVPAADGLLITVPFLRAGHQVTLPLAITSTAEPACRAVDAR